MSETSERVERVRALLSEQNLDCMLITHPSNRVYLTGFTAHSPMWRNNVKGLSLDKRVHVEWGRNETAWLDK